MTREEYAFFLEGKVPEFSFSDNNEIGISRLGLSITLFFKQGYKLDKREKILDCFRRFRQEFSSHLRFHRHEFKGMLKYSEDNIEKVEKKILSKGVYDYGGWVISDAHSADEAPNYLMSYLDSGDDSDNANSYLSMQFPWNFLAVENGLERFHDWVVYLCEQLEPDSGDCGYCLSLPNDYHEHQPIEYELARRYPSMQVNSTVHMCKSEYIDAIRGVNWFTILGKGYVKRLGGEDWIRRSFSAMPEITVENYPHGLIIRTGEYPDLTPINEGLAMTYRAVNQLIRPVRVSAEKIDSLHTYGINHFTTKTSVEWYARYDQGPLTVSPLESGTPALVTGYWTNPSFPHTMRIIKQGEMAPAGKAGEVIWWDLASEAKDDGNAQAPRS